MAEIRQKEIISIDSPWRGPIDDTYNGQTNQCWEALATARDNTHGPGQIVLRVFSLNIANKIKPGDTVNVVCIGKNQDGSKFKFKLMGRDNPQYKEGGGRYGGSSGGGGYSGDSGKRSSISYTFADIVTLHRRCYEEVSDYVDEDKTAATATLFIQCMKSGIMPGAPKQARASAQPAPAPAQPAPTAPADDIGDENLPF